MITENSKKPDMKPAEIRCAIELAGFNQKKIALKLGVSPGAVSRVIDGTSKSKRIADAISEIIGKPVNEIWNYYDDAA